MNIIRKENVYTFRNLYEVSSKEWFKCILQNKFLLRIVSMCEYHSYL